MHVNQHKETVAALEPMIALARGLLRAGTPASEVANRLHAQGLGGLHVMVVARQATGAGIAQLKAFCQWWREGTGVTDESSFNDWASQVFECRNGTV